MTPRLFFRPSGTHQIEEITITLAWSEALTEQRIYASGAEHPSIIIRPLPEGSTFEIDEIDGVTAIRCLLCGRVSERRTEVDRRRCDRCGLSHDLVRSCREAVAEGSGHDCGEWRTFLNACALCERPLPVEAKS